MSAMSPSSPRCPMAALTKWLSGAAGVLLLCGCTRGPTLYPVSGTVVFKGEPVPAGVIFFDPDISQKNDGPQGYAMIKDGKYSTAAEGGRGVVGGPYLVRIEAFDGKPGRELPLGQPLIMGFRESVNI